MKQLKNAPHNFALWLGTPQWGIFSFLSWSLISRIIPFWGIIVGTIYLTDAFVIDLKLELLWDRLVLIGSDLSKYGTLSPDIIEKLSDKNFVNALAFTIGAFAFSLLVAFVLMYVLYISFSLMFARWVISPYKDRRAFTDNYHNVIEPCLKNYSLIGHAWKEFDETLVKPKQPDSLEVIANTVRPHSFINITVAREKFFGLKMMGSIPGYFVGIGLVLTFVGIVLALHKAGEAATSGGSAEMKSAMADLLQIASFKFSTSIAGLFSSILLSFFFKAYLIWIEGSIARFCEAVEDALLYKSPQSISFDMQKILEEQKNEMKTMNSEERMARLGQEIAPLIQGAVSTAMAPVSDGISKAVDQMTEKSEQGASGLIEQFTNNIQQGAGTEMKELGETLKAMQATLASTQQSMSNTGADFSQRLSDAAENLNRLVSDAGNRLGESAEQNKNALSEVIQSLQATFEKANERVEKDLGSAASKASGQVEEAMGRVMEKLEGQISNLMSGLSGMQDKMSGSLTETQSQVHEAQKSAFDAINSASQEAARILDTSLTEALKRINTEVEQFEQALMNGRTALSAQANAIQEASGNTRTVSEALASTATSIRQASTPLLQSGERMTQATQQMNSVLDRVSSDLSRSSETTQNLTSTLAEKTEEMARIWNGYKEQFDKVDVSLGEAVRIISDTTQFQGDKLSDYAKQVDSNFADATNKLRVFLEDIRGNTELLADTLEKFSQSGPPNSDYNSAAG